MRTYFTLGTLRATRCFTMPPAALICVPPTHPTSAAAATTPSPTHIAHTHRQHPTSARPTPRIGSSCTHGRVASHLRSRAETVERLVGACRGALLLKNTNGETAADVRHLTAPAWPYALSAGHAELFFWGGAAWGYNWLHYFARPTCVARGCFPAAMEPPWAGGCKSSMPDG